MIEKIEYYSDLKNNYASYLFLSSITFLVLIFADILFLIY